MKILISGDFCPIGRTDKYLRQERYEELFNGFNKVVETVDYAIVNFECPITLSNQKLLKTGPCIKTENLNSLKALKYAGFDLLTLANNHIQDYGSKGVIDTLENAHKFGFETIGAGNNIFSAKKPLIKVIKGIKTGFLNIAENEFCAANEEDAGAYTFDLIDNIKQINLLKKEVDKLILIYHGGREHYQLPTPEQRKRFRFFIENGVDAIVAHHTHCFSGFEYYNGKPIVYSLGNFIFDYKKKYQKGKWTEGMSVILNLIDDKFELEIIPHFQGKQDNSTLQLLSNEEKEEFFNKIEQLSEKIKDDLLFIEEWENYLQTQEKFYLSSLYIKNLYIRALFMKGFFPINILKNKHNKLLLNLMRCEAHHEITKSILKKTNK